MICQEMEGASFIHHQNTLTALSTQNFGLSRHDNQHMTHSS